MQTPVSRCPLDAREQLADAVRESSAESAADGDAVIVTGRQMDGLLNSASRPCTATRIRLSSWYTILVKTAAVRDSDCKACVPIPISFVWAPTRTRNLLSPSPDETRPWYTPLSCTLKALVPKPTSPILLLDNLTLLSTTVIWYVCVGSDRNVVLIVNLYSSPAGSMPFSASSIAISFEPASSVATATPNAVVRLRNSATIVTGSCAACMLFWIRNVSDSKDPS